MVTELGEKVNARGTISLHYDRAFDTVLHKTRPEKHCVNARMSEIKLCLADSKCLACSALLQRSRDWQ